MRKVFLECAVVDLVYIEMRSLPRMFDKVNQPLKCHSNFGGVTYIHINTILYAQINTFISFKGHKKPGVYLR